MMTCPVCHGRKMVVGLADGVTLPCDQCEMTGLVPKEMVNWIEDGKKMRARRIHSQNGFRSLTEESKRRGISVIDLSRMERGIIKPVLEDYN